MKSLLIALTLIITACSTDQKKPCMFDGSCNYDENIPPPTIMEENTPETPKAKKKKVKKVQAK